MPVYLFQHPETEEVIEVIQRMKEPHVYVDESGTKWERLWVSPNASADVNIDPHNANAFNDKHRHNDKASYGDIVDHAKELSQVRKEKSGLGYDPVKRSYFDDWSSKRKGKRHPEDSPR
jgi:hypothetical protein